MYGKKHINIYIYTTYIPERIPPPVHPFFASTPSTPSTRQRTVRSGWNFSMAPATTWSSKALAKAKPSSTQRLARGMSRLARSGEDLGNSCSFWIRMGGEKWWMMLKGISDLRLGFWMCLLVLLGFLGFFNGSSAKSPWNLHEVRICSASGIVFLGWIYLHGDTRSA